MPMEGLTMNKYSEDSNLLYTQNQNQIARVIKFYNLEKDYKGELGEVVVLHFTTNVHNFILIRENNPINPLFILYALPVENDIVILWDAATKLLEECGITTEKYTREYEELGTSNYQHTANENSING